MLEFQNVNPIKNSLLQMVKSQGEEILDDSNKVISLMNDIIPDYERERRLLKHVLSNDVLKMMRKEDSHKIAIMKAREYMTNELFLADAAVEFVLTCFTHMMEWAYEPPANKPAQPTAAAPMMQNPGGNPIPFGSAHAAPARPVAAAPKPSAERRFTPEEAKRAAGLFSSTVKVPEGVTNIADFCFDGSRVKEITLPQSVYVIGEYAFSDCKKLKTLEMPPNVRRIGRGAFSSCGKLTMMRVPQGVTEIEDSTFEFCSSLEMLELPPTIASIGSEAFQGCISLKKLFLTDSVKYIDDDAFKMCQNLTVRCVENSYVHKFCTSHGVKCEPVRKGFAG